MGCSLGLGLHGERKDPEKSIRLEKIQSTAWDEEHARGKVRLRRVLGRGSSGCAL